MQSPAADAAVRRIEAARYVLQRRLALPMRERMVAHLEPVTVMAQVIGRRLQQPAPDVAHVVVDLGRVHGFARDAVGVNLDIVSWLAPEPLPRAPLDIAAQDCVALLRSELGVRGFSLVHQPGAKGLPVSVAAVRTVLPAVLFALCDEAARAARLTVAGDPSAPVLVVQVEDDPDAVGQPAPPPYRRLGWGEAQALAQDEGVELARRGDTATLRFPR